MALTVEEIETEYWAHHYLETPSKEEVEDEDFDLEAELANLERGAEGGEWETLISDEHQDTGRGQT